MSGLRRLREFGLLGINRRNADFTLRYNRRDLYPRVDDKLLTKRLCEEAGIPTPRLLAAARRFGDVRHLLARLDDHSSFVLKPARGAMGNGILVVQLREGDRLQRAGGRWISADDFLHHTSSILSGLYALGGQSDVAFVEERLEVHPKLAAVCESGIPDFRVISLLGIPVMAMTRLPTRSSRGRANLHQGAVGAGVDLWTGRTNNAVIGTVRAEMHPDTKEPVVDLPIPAFEEALEIAIRATDLTGLGYVGADVVVDAKRGPMILELNARPGLSIQIANRAGLLPRLRRVEREHRAGMPLSERLALGREIARVGSERK